MVVRADLNRMVFCAVTIGCMAAGCAKKEEPLPAPVTEVKALETPVTNAVKVEIAAADAEPTASVNETQTNDVAPIEEAASVVTGPVEVTNSRPTKTEKNFPAQEIFEQARAVLRERKDEQAGERALELIRKAAEAGNPPAQHALGVSYLSGIGVTKSVEDGLLWLNKSAAAGYAEAQYKLASLYMRGVTGAADEAMALQFVRKAADQGHPEAQYNLAILYATGKGVTKDMTMAAEWFRKAAEGGHATAQSNLGVLYVSGQAVEKNPEEAVKWWRKAAEQGQPSAQFNLGQALVEGKSAPKDLVEAYKWFSLAAEQGDRDARRMRDALGVELEPADVGESLKRAQEFKTLLRAKVAEEREQLF